MRIRTYLPLFFFLLILSLAVNAQVKFSTVVDEKVISRSDVLEVQYLVENAQSVEQITAPSFPGFTVLSGPNQQRSTTVNNGVVSQSQGISFILRPIRLGKFTIPGAHAIADGRSLQSNSVSVRVTDGPSHSQSSGMPFSPFGGMSLPDEVPEVSEEYLLRPGEKATDKIKNGLLVKLDVSKTSCYVGEPIIATYKLHSRL
ncbi:MAG: BatD family protein, partial [Bacteroidetes bacterium]|nr:BatD family protein [Bacteroidota bacterium]